MSTIILAMQRWYFFISYKYGSSMEAQSAQEKENVEEETVRGAYGESAVARENDVKN